MMKAVRALSQQLGVPVSVAGRQKHNHGPEPFLFKAQEELNYLWYNRFSTILKETYSFLAAYFGLPEITIISKADPLVHKGKILYSPETGQPIKKGDWDRFVETLEKYLNKKLKDTDKKIILDGKALNRILNRMLKYNTLEAVTELRLDDVKYRGKTLDWISDSVKNMQNTFGEQLSRSEAARIQVLQQSAAQKITKTTAAMKADIQQILIDGVKSYKSKGEISQSLFDRMTGANRDFQRIADTEIQNASNNSYLLDEVQNAEPGEKIYFQRVEIIDGNTCPFCKKMHGVIVLWSDHPLPSDKIDDPIADFAIWDGKDWDGKKDFIANGVFHPYCRGIWMRHNGTVDALVAHTKNQSELFDRAVTQAKTEYQNKGIKSPNDQTPGFIKRINDIYDVIGGEDKPGGAKKFLNTPKTKTPETAERTGGNYRYGPNTGNSMDRKIYGEAFNEVKREFEKQGIEYPTGKTPGFRDRVQEVYEEMIGELFDDTQKSLTFSGHKLQDRYRFAGLDISVENKKDSTRSGTDKDGHKWSIKMHYDYGYIRGSVGVDKDHVDVYIGSNENAPNVYIVHQNDPTTGRYDEDKVMLGFNSLKEAEKAYLKQYDRPGFLGRVDTMPIAEFKEKVLSKEYRGKVIKSISARVFETLRGII